MNEDLPNIETLEEAAALLQVGNKRKRPEKVLFRPDWPNRAQRRAQFGGMSAPDKASGVQKNPKRREALEATALAYIQEKVTCKVWEIPIRPETSSEHRAFIRRLEREGYITRDPFNPGYIHAIEQEVSSNHSED